MTPHFRQKLLFAKAALLILLFPPAILSQTASNISYPLASCTGGTCPLPATLPTHITASFFDTINEVIYIGGRFDDLGGNARPGLAAINAVDGSLLAWSPAVNNGTVTAIAKSGDTVFVGGTFTQINGQTRNRIAALSANTGQNFPVFTNGTPASSDTVTSLLTLGDKLYVGGRFTTIASAARTNLARFSLSGTIDPWIAAPAVSGTVKKLGWYGSNLVVLNDNSVTAQSEISIVNISSGARTLRAQTDPGELICDFAMRGSTVFFTGPFFTVNSILRTETAACDLSTGTLSAWNPVPAVYSFDTRSRFHIEYYRDSLYIGVCDISSNQPTYHKIYVSHYTNGGLRVLKTYQSNLSGLNGYFCDELLAGNARLFEIERYAQHTSFPNGSINCRFFSYCLKPPSLPGPYATAPTQICPGDTNVLYAVQPLAYFSAYTWQSPNLDILPSGNAATTSVDFRETYSVTSTLRVWGVTSCGISTSSFRSMGITPKAVPSASAGNDDTLNCLRTQITLHGTSATSGASFNWQWTNAGSNTDSILVAAPDTYVLTVHAPNGCWKRDTTIVSIDTIRPAIVPFTNVPLLTCIDTLITLDASALYPNDSLYWSGPGLVSPENPASMQQSGNFLLTILSRETGCSNSDTIFVGQNISVPSASIVAADTLLTCNRDSILLDANSTSTGTYFQWSDTAGTIFNNPLTVFIPGSYQLHAISPINGCENSANIIFISAWTTPPGINPLPDSVFLNCSYDSLTITANSLTSGSSFSWSGPNNYAANDSAVIAQTGYYFVTATHPQNGCSSRDSVYAGYIPVLIVDAGNDTTICPGSGAVLQAFPLGGTAPFSFSWNHSAGNGSPVTVYPSDTLTYIVSVSDTAGCSGSDTVTVNVPDPLTDSVQTFQPCDPNQLTGQIQAHAFAGVPPYQYSIDNGLSWNGTGVFPNLGYGNYSVLIADAIGCTTNANAVIDTNSLSPQPDFLISSSSQEGDTIVVVDISNPRPDSVHWDFPPLAIVTDSNPFSPAFVNGDTGIFTITMHAFYGSCEVVYSRMVNVHPFDSLAANPWNANGIDTMILYPNPNNGVFNFSVQLEAKQRFVILVFDETGNERARIPVNDAAEWNGSISVPNPVPGNYVLRVIAEYDSDELIFVITQ